MTTSRADRVKWLVVGSMLALAAGAPIAAAVQMPEASPAAAYPVVDAAPAVVLGELRREPVVETSSTLEIFPVAPRRGARRAPRRAAAAHPACEAWGALSSAQCVLP
jgi:hypothetical protein